MIYLDLWEFINWKGLRNVGILNKTIFNEEIVKVYIFGVLFISVVLSS